MKITAIVVGRASAPMKDAILEYETRVGRYWKFKVIEVASGGRGVRKLTRTVPSRRKRRCLWRDFRSAPRSSRSRGRAEV